MMGRNLDLLLACFLCIAVVENATAIKSLRVLSPLRALTIWDPETKEEPSTARSRFLPVFRARLQAESEARKDLKAKKDQELQASATSSGWAESAAISDRRRRRAEERFVEDASDRAAAKAGASIVASSEAMKKNPNKYQFVGVVNPKASGKPIKWYARPKPAGSKWSVRLVHADQAAIITDLFRQGKVDIFAKYKNTGKVNPETNTPVIESEYTVRERSFRNLWNFSPKHLFSDSSGMYWRERRVRPGLYTDGNNVFEATYRYRDGKNGMHRLSTLEKFMGSKSVSPEQKQTIQKRLKDDVPDLVVEE